MKKLIFVYIILLNIFAENTNSININLLVDETYSLMSSYNIRIRDTWNKKSDINKKLSFIFKEVPHTQLVSKGIKHSSDKKCLDYRLSTIEIPFRLKNRTDNIIHELVHFLQWNTIEEEEKYIQYDGKNMTEYISQRIEQEAFFIQLVYLYQNTPGKFFNLTKEEKLIFEKMINNKNLEIEKRILLILFAKGKEII